MRIVIFVLKVHLFDGIIDGDEHLTGISGGIAGITTNGNSGINGTIQLSARSTGTRGKGDVSTVHRNSNLTHGFAARLGQLYFYYFI